MLNEIVLRIARYTWNAYYRPVHVFGLKSTYHDRFNASATLRSKFDDEKETRDYLRNCIEYRASDTYFDTTAVLVTGTRGI